MPITYLSISKSWLHYLLSLSYFHVNLTFYGKTFHDTNRCFQHTYVVYYIFLKTYH